MDILRYDTSDFNPITETGTLQQYSVSETAPLHTHEFFEIFLVTEGKALHLVNDAVQNIEAGNLVLIRPDDIHCYGFYQSFDFAFINVAFTIQTMSKITELFFPETPLQEILSAPLPPIACLSAEETKLIFEELRSINHEDYEKTPETSKHYFKGLLAFILCRYFIREEKKKTSAPRWLAAVAIQMQSLENFQKGFSHMLQIAACSKEHLCREFKKYYTVTPTQFINSQRLSYSVYLLSNSSLEITEIADLCGFNSLSHFYHLFREKFGISPARFRSIQKGHDVINPS